MIQSLNENALLSTNQQPQRKYDPFSHTYNPGWRDHPNLRYGNQPQQGNQGRQFHPHRFQPQ